jgi:hypothetical protein
MHYYATSYWNHIEVSASCLSPTEIYFTFKFRSYFYFQLTIFYAGSRRQFQARIRPWAGTITMTWQNKLYGEECGSKIGHCYIYGI